MACRRAVKSTPPPYVLPATTVLASRQRKARMRSIKPEISGSAGPSLGRERTDRQSQRLGRADAAPSKKETQPMEDDDSQTDPLSPMLRPGPSASVTATRELQGVEL